MFHTSFITHLNKSWAYQFWPIRLFRDVHFKMVLPLCINNLKLDRCIISTKNSNLLSVLIVFKFMTLRQQLRTLSPKAKKLAYEVISKKWRCVNPMKWVKSVEAFREKWNRGKHQIQSEDKLLSQPKRLLFSQSTRQKPHLLASFISLLRSIS